MGGYKFDEFEKAALKAIIQDGSDLTNDRMRCCATIGANAAFKYLCGTNSFETDFMLENAMKKHDIPVDLAHAAMHVEKQEFENVYFGIEPVSMEFAAKYGRYFKADGWWLYVCDARKEFEEIRRQIAKETE